MDGMHGNNAATGGLNMGSGGEMDHPHKMMTHMTFFWGKNALILFPGWPGSDGGMYVLALLLVFVLAVLVEWLSHCNLVREDKGSRTVSGLLRTLMHTGRVGLAYLVMLAVMSFNVGVFIVAVGGHGVGYLLFGSRVFEKSSAPVLGKPSSNLPPMVCV